MNGLLDAYPAFGLAAGTCPPNDSHSFGDDGEAGHAFLRSFAVKSFSAFSFWCCILYKIAGGGG